MTAATPCTGPALGYTDSRGVRNLVDGSRSVTSGIFVCTPAWIPSMVGGAGNTQYPPPSQRGSEPPAARPWAFASNFRNVEEASHGQ